MQRWAIWDKNGQKSATLLPSSILHSSSTLQIMSNTLPLSGVEEWKSGRVITLPLLSIKKASAKASANSRRVEEWKSGRSITLPLPGVEEWKIATLPLSEWKSDRPDCPSLVIPYFFVTRKKEKWLCDIKRKAKNKGKKPFHIQKSQISQKMDDLTISKHLFSKNT